MELTTAVKYGIPIKHVLLEQQRARQDQQGAARRRLPGLAHLPAQPRLGGVRRALRRDRHPVTGRDQLDEAMTALFATDGPALLCIEQDAELL